MAAEDVQGRMTRRLATIAGHLVQGAPQGPRTVVCCGIIAVVGKEPAVQVLVEGLKILESRGYDSAGIATIDSRQQLITTKYASKGSTSNAIQLLEEKSAAHGSNVIGPPPYRLRPPPPRPGPFTLPPSLPPSFR